MATLTAIILAAGKGTRMKSDLAKVLHPLAGRPMLAWCLEAARAVAPDRLLVVTGHQHAQVAAACQGPDIEYVLQAEQLGTGHAVMTAARQLPDTEGDVLILCGDTPLLQPATLQQLVAEHREHAAAVTVLTATPDNPDGYGRILRNACGNLTGIVEHRDATPEQRSIHEINTGVYCCESAFLQAALAQLGTDNDQGEYYLPDIIAIGARQERRGQTVKTPHFDEVQGINDRQALAASAACLRQQILQRHMREGVTIIDPAATYVDADVTIGRDTTLHPGVILRGRTTIGTGCVIDAGAVLSDTQLGTNVQIRPGSIVSACRVADNAVIGPYAHLRDGCAVASHATVGNFVEAARTTIGEHSIAAHLAYLGDTTVAAHCTIGAGTVTCNYDGSCKYRTTIDEQAFIGSNTALVAPVAIGRGAVTGAGSVITDNIPDNQLGIARARQTNLPYQQEKPTP